jgi:hypothetical protein
LSYTNATSGLNDMQVSLEGVTRTLALEEEISIFA